MSIKISANLKDKSGKSFAKQLRKEGRVPAIVYGKKQLMISLLQKEVVQEYQKGNFFVKIFDIDVDGKSLHAIPRDIQLDPVSDFPIHVDFQEINMKEKVKLPLSVKVINEDKSVGLKRGGVMNLAHRTIDIICDPKNIPGTLTVDISKLEINRSLHINDIALPEGVETVDKSNFVVVSITGRSKDDAEESATTTA